MSPSLVLYFECEKTYDELSALFSAAEAVLPDDPEHTFLLINSENSKLLTETLMRCQESGSEIEYLNIVRSFRTDVLKRMVRTTLDTIGSSLMCMKLQRDHALFSELPTVSLGPSREHYYLNIHLPAETREQQLEQIETVAEEFTRIHGLVIPPAMKKKFKSVIDGKESIEVVIQEDPTIDFSFSNTWKGSDISVTLRSDSIDELTGLFIGCADWVPVDNIGLIVNHLPGEHIGPLLSIVMEHYRKDAIFELHTTLSWEIVKRICQTHRTIIDRNMIINIGTRPYTLCLKPLMGRIGIYPLESSDELIEMLEKRSGVPWHRSA